MDCCFINMIHILRHISPLIDPFFKHFTFFRFHYDSNNEILWNVCIVISVSYAMIVLVKAEEKLP